ncbi:hypothetical protein IMCC26134_04770 [Verrucomicrobia bacterium IMCC26134]|jgi:hypothetical protein|nr:hypothetical protein IMCC26134_04770 [Verrucomicrobia bacterium IMCC26134]
MKSAQIMSREEIHAFGIEVVAKQLIKEGIVVEGINTQIGLDPQIRARKSGVLSFIVVRTACYPDKGMLDPDVHFQMIEYADKHQAIPYFASVGIGNATGKSDKEMSIPIKGAGFYIAYNGLLIITRSDRVSLAGE